MTTRTTKAPYNLTNEIPGLGRPLRKVGDAAKDHDNFYYVIRLFVLPSEKYFLAKHPVRNGEYNLYSARKPGGFCKPVGRARAVCGTNYVRIEFHDLQMTFYMRFTPNDYEYVSNAA